MIKKYKKKTPKILYLILFSILFSSVFVVLGLFKYLFVYSTSFVIHFLFVSSGSFFLFCTIIFILELMEEEGIEYSVTEKGLSMARVPFFYTCILKWEDITSISNYTIKYGNRDSKFYLIKDSSGNEISLGEEIEDLEGLVEFISQKTTIEPQEIETLKEYKVSPFYFYKPGKEKVKNSEGWRLKIYNFFNMILIAFLLISFTVVQTQSAPRSDEINNIILYIQVIMGLLFVVPIINLAFYKIWQKTTIVSASKIIFLLINSAIICFSIFTVIGLIYFYQAYAAQLHQVYPLLVILLMVFIFYPLGNLNAIVWLRKLK